ncbi:MAG: hydroxymethylglutaryl-CoA synthase [Nitrososphaerota archaeon]|jgi:hydroxymethylglutaryl-CoA synthase|nr:hydroxymethylglutaryl-CoA synthase [Nitrososphaerota archaeon]
MRSKDKAAIIGYGAYVPYYRLPTTEIARVWKGGGSGPNVEKAVASIDEDTVTMAIEASRYAMKMAGVDRLGAVFVGTESKPYAVKPSGTIVAQALGQHHTLAADLEFACKAGTEAMQIVTALVGSGMIEAGLAVGMDTAQGRPGDDLEYTAASGGAAYVIGRASKRAVAAIDCSTSYVSDTGDFWRRAHERYPRHLSRFTGEPAYFHHVESSVKTLFEETGHKPSDFKYAVFHQPNPRFPVEVATRLGFTSEQIKTGLLNPLIGNTYSGSSPIGMAAVLDEASPGDKILLASFGSGAGSDAFCIEVLEGIEATRGVNPTVKSMMERSTKIDYSTYSKFRDKLHK